MLGTVSAALVVAPPLMGLLMPLVIAALAPGFAGHADAAARRRDARLMLPYLAFAGPVTVMMALLNAQGRFALTAFSPLLFNIALIAVMAALLLWRGGAEFRRTDHRRDRRHRRAAAIADPGVRMAAAIATPLRVILRRARCAAFSRARFPA